VSPAVYSSRPKFIRVLALVRFYIRGGVRLAWRAAIPVVAAPTVAVAMSMDPSGTLHGFAQGAVAPDGGTSVTLSLAMASLALAAWATRKLAYGVSAWIRHLPAGEDAHRRAILAGLVMAQLPVVFLFAVLGVVAALSRIPVDGARVFGIVVMVLGAAHLTLPCSNRVVAAFAGLIAISVALTAEATLMGVGLAAFFVADRWGGPVYVSRHVRRSWSERRPPRTGALPLLITWRAIRHRWLVGYVLSAVVLAINALFVRNNDLSPQLAALATRFGGGLALLAALTFLGKLISTSRPPWAWARALPWSSFRRVADDTAFLVTSALPLLATIAFIDTSAVITVSLALPYMAARLAAAVRYPVNDLTLAELFLVIGLLALFPLTAFACVLLTPFALSHASRKERQTRPSHFESMSASGRGDTQSWSGG